VSGPHHLLLLHPLVSLFWIAQFFSITSPQSCTLVCLTNSAHTTWQEQPCACLSPFSWVPPPPCCHSHCFPQTLSDRNHTISSRYSVGV
jgi:hypothetical protein